MNVKAIFKWMLWTTTARKMKTLFFIHIFIQLFVWLKHQDLRKWDSKTAYVMKIMDSDNNLSRCFNWQNVMSLRFFWMASNFWFLNLSLANKWNLLTIKICMLMNFSSSFLNLYQEHFLKLLDIKNKLKMKKNLI